MKKLLLSLLIISFALSACTSKPSRGQVESALKEQILYTTEINSDEARQAVDTYVECFVDEIYDNVDADTLRKYVETEVEERRDPFGSDQEELGDQALEKCSSELVQE